MANRLKRKERELLKKLSYDPKYFVRLSKSAEAYEFLETQTGKILTVRR
ncbi:MAG: hypothetical protein K0R54_4392 [Clostridiaceae bacterium]|jgi:hypothetical protein|nr:hypothetical protein [Clostridiaceae bacterium]